MKNHLLTIALLLYSFQNFGQIKESQAIDSIFAEWEGSKPGCALGIIKNGELVYAKGYGMANMEYDIPNSPTSVFRIGSTAKQFTAACIILLVEQGKLKLEDNLKSIFPDFPDYANNINIRHLLNHTSGIRDYLQLSYLKGLRNDDYYEDEEIMQWLVNQSDLNFEPGAEFLYSNSGYWLLGQIVEKVSGQNMAKYAEEMIFKPLGMNSTHFHNDHTLIVKNRASGYAPDGKNDYKISMTTLDMIGDGGIFTSIEDIKKWDDAYYASDVLSKDFWDMMTQKGVLNNGEELDYASGLDISEYKGLKTIRHGGAFVGFRADLLRFPEEKLSIAIFANRADANPSAKANMVADILLKDKFISSGMEVAGQKEFGNKAAVKLSTAQLEQFSKDYWNESELYSRKIYVKNDTLRYKRNQYSESPLLPVSNKQFRMIGVPVDVQVKFDEPKPNMMSVVVDGGTASIFKAYSPISYTKDDLKRYEGKYHSQELDVNYALKLEGDYLILYIKDNKHSALAPILTNLFSNDNYGVFQFNEDADGKITDFRLASGRVKNLLFKKI